MKEVNFIQMKDGTKEDYLLLSKHEKKFIENEILTKISTNAKGDLRAAINDLQSATESKDKTNIAKIYTQTVDTHKWIDAHKAYYSRTDNTTMGYGFGAYEHPKSGLISFEKMRELMLQGQNLQDPFVKKSLLGKDLAK